jgi:hypothetical protein
MEEVEEEEEDNASSEIPKNLMVLSLLTTWANTLSESDFSRGREECSALHLSAIKSCI